MLFKPKTPYAKVRKCITSGCVTGREISDVVGDLEANLGVQERQAFHDEVADAARYYGLGGRAPGFFQRLYLAGKDLADKTANLATAVVGAAAGAEIVAAKSFAGTILAGKLASPGDHLLYWLGKKTVEVSGPDMINALYQLTASTPYIVAGMAIGALTGYIGYKLARNIVNGAYTNWQVSRKARRILDAYCLAGNASEPELQSREQGKEGSARQTGSGDKGSARKPALKVLKGSDRA